MKTNNTIGLALMALLTLGAGTAIADSSETEEMKKKEDMTKMEEMKKEGMKEMDGMKTEAMEKMDGMKEDGMEKMDSGMKKDHKKKAAMDS